jgi:hypothetical protein
MEKIGANRMVNRIFKKFYSIKKWIDEKINWYLTDEGMGCEEP